MPERRVLTQLLATDRVTALVGDRVKPISQLQGVALPTVTYQTVVKTLINHSTGATTTESATIQINSYAETYEGAKVLARAVRSSLSGWSSSTGSPEISSCHLQSDSDIPDGPESDEDSFIHGVMQDYELWYATT